MEDLLKKFEEKRPEIIFEWNDSETDARGWLVINTLKNGSAGGGTRMRKGLNMREVESLAKTMEIKFSVSGPPIGGAKSGIDFDPKDPRKREVLRRWYRAVAPLLKMYYGTGGDMNVDQNNEVIPIAAEFGILHPQEGTVNGHLKDYTPEEKLQAISRLQTGVTLKMEDPRFTPDVSRGYTIGDMITGWGVAEAIRHFYGIWGGTMNHKRAIIQGWGNVAAAAAFYLAKNGVAVIGIIDREGGLINENGFTIDEITELFLNRNGNQLHAPNMLSFEETNQRIWKLGAEIFVPGAGSRLVTNDQVQDMIDGGMEVVSCGANVPFADEEIFMGPISRFADENMAVIPDFIANCGMARVFAYLMQRDAVVKDVDILMDASSLIERAMMRVHQFNIKPTNISKKALELSLMNVLKGEVGTPS
ncbi:MAG: amino acid dehydrogenase [Flavobacteriales bacterium]|nr:amino acid dehydrogenase [Bacteroidota bacterium]MCB9240625.1 amino acid dehydrogenase [Flavobacteriales bacterium]